MKNEHKKGRSVRNGNAPSPYSKYQKKPHRYSPELRTWRQQYLRHKEDKS